MATSQKYGSDRGFFSEKNVTSCKQQGVKVVCIPQRGGTKTPEREAYEKSREFKELPIWANRQVPKRIQERLAASATSISPARQRRMEAFQKALCPR